MHKISWAFLVIVVALSLPLTACQDTKTLQENERLKAQVTELRTENSQLASNLESVTAARDALTKENEVLKGQIKGRKTKRSATKSSTRKRRPS